MAAGDGREDAERRADVPRPFVLPSRYWRSLPALRNHAGPWSRRMATEAELVRDSAIRRGEGGPPRRRYVPFRRRRGAEPHLTHRRQAELSDARRRRARPRPKALGPSADA